MVRSIQKNIILEQSTDTKVVSLACTAASPGYFRECSLKYKAALALARGVSLEHIPQSEANHYVAKEIINKKEYLKYGTRTKLSLHCGSGVLVGHHIRHLY